MSQKRNKFWPIKCKMILHCLIKLGCPSTPLAWNYVLRLCAHGLLMMMMKMMMRVMMMMLAMTMMMRMMIVKILVPLTLTLIKFCQMSRLRVRSLLGSQVELALCLHFLLF